MPKINVYLPDDLAEAVKLSGLPVSAVCQRALEEAVRRVTMIRETAAELLAGPPDGDPLAHPLNLTRRALSVLKAAQASAATRGAAQIGTEHLLTSLLDEGNNLGLRVLHSLEIDTSKLAAALARSGSAAPAPAGKTSPPDPAGAVEPGFGPQALTALELAVTEAIGLGNNYVGCEHLLLGLVSEPAGAAGKALRDLGADPRFTRRAVAALLAGWSAGRSAGATGSAAGAGLPAAWVGPLTATIRAELAPVVRRLDQVERQLAATG